MIIAVDGPAASGKSTLAKRIAAHYGLPHLDTGSLYRAVARDVLIGGGKLDDPQAGERAALGLDPGSLDDPALRKRGLGEAASIVAALPAVRAALLNFQRGFAGQAAGAVIEGRDIGTVICPDADVKIFVNASAESRARRRYLELSRNGERMTAETILAEIRERDRRDQTRAAAPLRQAPDAHLLDTTKLDIEAAFNAAVELIKASAGR